MWHEHPAFTWAYEAMGRWEPLFGLDRERRALVGRLGGRVLEVGAGNGRNLAHYAPTSKVVAIEPEPHMMRLAQARAGRALLVRGDAEELPFASGSFDTVVACLVLCTIPSPDRALGEICRVLRPGGMLHFLEHIRARGALLTALQDALDPVWSRLCGGCHPNRATLDLFERQGLHIESMRLGRLGLFVRGVAQAVKPTRYAEPSRWATEAVSR